MKRTIDDSEYDLPYGPSASAVTERHYGPGRHPGTGTPQEVHAGDGDKPQAASGGSQRPGIRTVIANAHHERVEVAIGAARADTGFGEALYTDEGAVIYDDREAFTLAVMRQIAERRIEIGLMIDDRGYVEYQSTWGEMTDDWFGGDENSIAIPDAVLLAYRRSRNEGRNPVFIHSHPTLGERSSPPSAADLGMGSRRGIFNHRVAAKDGYYEFSFSRTMDDTEREEWRQIADIWDDDNPQSEALTDARSRLSGGSRGMQPHLRDELWQRQHEALTHIAQEMPDLFEYRFVPWSE